MVIAGELRQQAEAIVRESIRQTPEILEALSPEKAWLVFHELRVHQIQLEMQNEELRRTQEDLQASRARYFDLFDLAPVGYLTLSDQGLILEANLEFSTWVGVPKSSLCNRPLSQFISSEEQGRYYLHRNQLAKTGLSKLCELRLVKKDGTKLWIQMETNLAQDAGGATLVRATLSDIAARKQAGAALAESEARYRTVLEQSPEAVLLIDETMPRQSAST